MSSLKKSEFLLDARDYFAEVVDAGIEKRKVKVVPAARDYLIGLLQFYLDARNLFDEPHKESGERNPQTLAEMYLKAGSSDFAEKVELLKKLADRSLYISGFFADSLNRKLVDVDYYAEMGGAAYGSLAEVVREDTLAQVYRTFSCRFIEFADILSYISHSSMVQSDQNLLQLYDRYLRTGSEAARDRLHEMGVLTSSAHTLRSKIKIVT